MAEERRQESEVRSQNESAETRNSQEAPGCILTPDSCLLSPSSYLTVKLTTTVFTAPAADVATIVIDFVPVVAVVAPVNFSELLPAAGFVMLAGVNAAVTPAGRPVTVMASAPENPPVTDVVTGIVTVEPRVSEAVVEVVATLNPLTTSVTTAVGNGVTPPPVPVMVIG